MAAVFDVGQDAGIVRFEKDRFVRVPLQESPHALLSAVRQQLLCHRPVQQDRMPRFALQRGPRDGRAVPSSLF